MNVLIVVHVSCEGPGVFDPMLRDCGAAVRVVDVERGEPLPPDLHGVDALVIMGGPMNAYEEAAYPFLRQEDFLLRQAIVRDVPVMGICLGAQLLAKAADAPVRHSPVAEFGWSRVRLTPSGRRDPLFSELGPDLLVFQWHQDTFDVPANGELLATSPAVPSQAIRVGRRAYGLQFHIELDRRLLDLWMHVAPQERDDLDEQTIRHITTTFEEHEQRLAEQAATVVRNFHRIAVGT